MVETAIISNMVGPEGEAIDRIYGSPAGGGSMRLIKTLQHTKVRYPKSQ